jgi:hypothetical protein
VKLSIHAGATSETAEVFIQDSSKTDGSGLTGLVYNTANLTCYYSFPRGASTAVTLATLGSATAAWATGGFKEIDATNKPGCYRFDIPNALLASGNGRYVNVYFRGATNMAPCPLEIELTGWDNQDGSAGGMSRIDAAISSRMATFTLPANFSLLSIDADGEVLADVVEWLGVTVGALPANFSSLVIDANGRVEIQSGITKNVAFNNFPVPMVLSSDHITPATGKTVAVQRSLDGVAFATCTNSPATEISNGAFVINLTAAELNAGTVWIRASAAGCDDRLIAMRTTG